MKTIRKNCFETNSSSTHSLCITTEDKYMYDDDLSFEENIKNYLDEFEYYPCEYPQSLETWKDGDELESDTNIYISPSGDKLKIICKYGYIG